MSEWRGWLQQRSARARKHQGRNPLSWRVMGIFTAPVPCNKTVPVQITSDFLYDSYETIRAPIEQTTSAKERAPKTEKRRCSAKRRSCASYYAPIGDVHHSLTCSRLLGDDSATNILREQER